MHEMFISDIFNRYQVKQIEAMTKVAIGFSNKKEYAECAGAKAVIQAIIKLPEHINSSEDVKQHCIRNIRRANVNYIMGELKE